MANARPAYNGVALPGGAAYQSRCRQVATFNGVSQYVTIPPLSISNGVDFEIECEIVLSTPQHSGAILGGGSNTGAERFVFYQNSAAPNRITVQWPRVSGAYYPSVVVDTADILVLKRVGNSLTLVSDSGSSTTLDVTDTDPAGILIAELGRWSNGLYFLGILKNIKIWTGGDRNTGTLVRDYPLDDGFASSPTIRDLASSQDGTAINFTVATWSERCDL